MKRANRSFPFLVLSVAFAHCGCESHLEQPAQSDVLNEGATHASEQIKDDRQAVGGFTYRDSEHGVAILFPFEPQVFSEQPIPGDAFADGKSRTGHIVSAENQAGAFACVFYKHRILLENFDAAALLDAAARNIGKTENGTIQEKKPIIVDGLMGRDVLISLTYQGVEETKKVRILCNNSTVCYAMWLGEPDKEPVEMVTAFLQSLKLE